MDKLVETAKTLVSPERIQEHVTQLDAYLAQYPLAIEMERRTNVRKSYLFIGSSVAFTLLIINNIMGSLLVNLVGFVYPAYASFQAIESPQKDDDVQWLTYWVVFSFFNVLEFFSDLLLFWVPFYFVFKVIGLIYLFAPQTKVLFYCHNINHY